MFSVFTDLLIRNYNNNNQQNAENVGNYSILFIGRQSLTRLASFIAEFNCFQIELTKAYGQSDWKDDIKNLMLTAGLMKRESVFIFSDTQVRHFILSSIYSF